MKKDLQYLKKLFSRPFHAKRAGGQTNRNYIVAVGRKKFFVRLPWESHVMDRRAEGRNILALSRNKKIRCIVPKYYLYVLSRKNILNPKGKTSYDLPDGTMMVEYLWGKEFPASFFQQKRYQRALAKTLYLFHTSGVRFSNSYNPFRDEIKKYRMEAFRRPVQKLLDKKTIAQLQTLETQAHRCLLSSKRGVSTHNDVILQNFLLGKKGTTYLLDFEYAGLNTKGGIFYDLGYPLRDSFFNPPQISKKTFERFLIEADAVYKKKLDRNQIYWSVIAALLVGIWWGVLRFFDAPKREQPYFSRYVQRGVKGLLALAAELKKKES
ncbi:MAG: phosphotransferase [bacterium]|nr:phosphotransferase [bacterium]